MDHLLCPNCFGESYGAGPIAKVVRDRGFGFIRGNDGKEVFFHAPGSSD